MSKVIDDLSFDENVIDQKEDCIVSFTATWSPESQFTSQSLKSVEPITSDTKFYKIDVGGSGPSLKNNHNPETQDRFDIRIFPTLLYFKKGQLCGALIGQSDAPTINSWIQTSKAADDNHLVPADKIKPYLQSCYEQIQTKITEQVEDNLNKAIRRKRSVSLISSFAQTAGGVMLASLRPELTFLFISGSIIGPEVLNIYNHTFKKDELLEKPRFKNMFVRTAFNLASIAGGAFLASAAIASAGAASTLLGGTGLVLGGYLILAASARVLRDIGDFMTTDLEKLPPVKTPLSVQHLQEQAKAKANVSPTAPK